MPEDFKAGIYPVLEEMAWKLQSCEMRVDMLSGYAQQGVLSER